MPLAPRVRTFVILNNTIFMAKHQSTLGMLESMNSCLVGDPIDGHYLHQDVHPLAILKAVLWNCLNGNNEDGYV